MIEGEEKRGDTLFGEVGGSIPCLTYIYIIER